MLEIKNLSAGVKDKEILDNIKWRHQTIKNMIEWRKFTSGV